MASISLAAAFWLGLHLIVAGPLRARLVGMLGEQPFRVILFGAVLVTAVNGMVSIDRKRRRALGPRWDALVAQTSRVPFAAILAGRTRFEISEFRAWQIALAVVLFAGVFWLHGIIGPSP